MIRFVKWISKSLFLGIIIFSLVSCSDSKVFEPSYTWSPVEINGEIKGSDKIEAVIAPYRMELDSIMDEVIGYASHDLTTAGEYESTLGTFVTKLLLDQSVSSFKQSVDVAIMNHKGGLRAPINKGEITLGEIFEVMPFENEMVLLEVPGDVMLEVVQRVGRSGRSMMWPVSFKVSEEGPQNIRIDGKPLQMDKNYILSVSDYMANGGGGFRMLKDLKRLDTPPAKLRDFIVEEIIQRTAQGDSIQQSVQNTIAY